MEMHGSGLLSTLVVSLVFAFAGGVGARSLGLPPLAGYLVAGIAVGPFTPGFVADQRVATELAEVGVALLLFGVGLHFSAADLWRVRRIAVPGALAQIVITTSAGVAVGLVLLGTTGIGAIVVGLSLAIASTAAATRALAERGRLDTLAGRIALGWLVVQDVVVILALVLLPLAAREGASTASDWLIGIGQVVLQVTGFVAAMALVGRRLIPLLLDRVARLGSRELFTLCVIVIALGVAAATTALFGISFALGAFFAGVVLRESDLSHQAAAETLPLQEVFTVLFFVSIGMLFDPSSLLRMPLEIAAVLIAIIVCTGMSTLVVLLVLRCSVETATLIGAAFAQIGEFSFILTKFAVGGGLITSDTRDVVLAAALLAIIVNVPIFRLGAALAGPLAAWPALARWRGGAEPAPGEPLSISRHAILVGHGRVGTIVADAMTQHSLPFVVIEADRIQAEKLKMSGRQVIFGDATREEVLAAASPRHARLLVVALPDAFHARQVIALARKANPAIETVVRTHSDEEADFLNAEAGVGLVVMGEREVAFSMTDFSLQRLGIEAGEAQETVNTFRAKRQANGPSQGG